MRIKDIVVLALPALVMLLWGLAVGAEPPTSPFYDSASQTCGVRADGTALGDICLPDDTALNLGGTCAAPDYWIEYDATQTRLEYWTTDSDGGGTDLMYGYVDDGTQLWVLNGGVDISGSYIRNPTIIYEVARTTDNPARTLVTEAGNAYYKAAGQTDGADYTMCGGIAVKSMAVVQATSDTSTITITTTNGLGAAASTTLTLVSGAPGAGEIQCITSDAVCAAAIVTYLASNVTGVTAEAVAAQVYLIPSATLCHMGLTSAHGGGTKFILTNGVDGVVALGIGQRVVFNDAGDDYMVSTSDSHISTIINANTITILDNTGFEVNDTLAYMIDGRLKMSSPVDGNMLLTDDAGTDFGLLQGGGVGAGYPAWKRSGAGWLARLADDSGAANVGVSTLTGVHVTVTGTVTGGKFRVKSDKAAYTNVLKPVAESVTFNNDASKATVGGLIVDGCYLIGISGRVTTALAGCTSIDIGDGAIQDLYGDNIAVADTTTFTAADATADYAALQWDGPHEVTVTANGGNCTSGVVALTSHCMSTTAATAD